ncbi:MAG: B12-binding domain-containing radical SAM protein [Gammaproteobacteria bacterium]|nr:B12-binding domain-containing radical SAM protein [Gammaproteobacteria bacterium]
MKPYPPLGLLYIAAYLRSRGFDVEVLDTTFMRREEHLGQIAARKPPIIGIYANLMTRRNVFRIIDTARAAGSKVVLGGPEPVNYSSEYLRRGADVIVAGEGELTLEALIPAIASGRQERLALVDGIMYKNAEGKTVTTAPREQIKNLDNRPFPARDCIDMQRYLDAWRDHHGASAVSIITARGCPYTCRWCSHSVYGFSYRRRSPGDVADELELIQANYAPDRIWYADDVFAMSRHWLRDFAAELKLRNLHFPFETISREDRLDDEVIDVLASMGCYRLWVGAESGSQKILDAMDRRTDAVRMRSIIRKLQERGIKAGTFIMLGYDGEDWADINATSDHLCAALPDEVLTTLAYPIKGTPFFDNVRQRIIANGDWETGSDRSLSIAGRHSTRFYTHAQKWIRSRVQLSRAMKQGLPGMARVARLYATTQKHRAAMYLTRWQVEAAQDA